jgi:hypothetical protein
MDTGEPAKGTADIRKPGIGERCDAFVNKIVENQGQFIIGVQLAGIFQGTEALLFGPPEFQRQAKLGDRVEGAVVRRWGANGLILEIETADLYRAKRSPSATSPAVSPATARNADLLGMAETPADPVPQYKSNTGFDIHGVANPPTRVLITDSQGKIQDGRDRNLLGLTIPRDMLGKLVHLIVTKTGDTAYEGQGKLVSAVQSYNDVTKVLEGRVQVAEIPWATGLNTYYFGVRNAQIGDLVAKGQVSGFIPEARKLIVNCFEPKAPEVVAIDYLEATGWVQDKKVRIHTCYDTSFDDATVGKEEEEKRQPAGQVKVEAATVTTVTAKDNMDSNKRQKVVDSSSGSVTATSPSPVAAPVPVANPVTNPPEHSEPSPTSDPTESDSNTGTGAADKATATLLPPGLRTGDFVHVVTLEEMERFTGLFKEMQQLVSQWAERKSSVGTNPPVNSTSTASGSVTGSGGRGLGSHQ